MRTWNKILCGSSIEQEQTCVGTQAVGETATQIYEVKTVAVIGQSQSEVESSNSMVKLCQNITAKHYTKEGNFIAIYNSLIAFDGKCSEKLMDIHLPSSIECFTLDEGVVFVALKNANVVCLCLSSSGIIQTERNIDELKKSEGVVSIELYNTNRGYELIIVTQSFMLRFVDVDLKKFHSADAESIQRELLALKYYVTEFSVKVNNCILDKYDNSCFMTGYKIDEVVNSCSLCLLHFVDGQITEYLLEPLSTESAEKSSTIIKLEIVENLGLFVLLTNTGDLILLCRYTLMIINKINSVETESAKTFTIFQSTSEPCILLFGLSLICLTIPNFEKRFKLKISPMNLPMFNQYDDDKHEGIMFLEICEVEPDIKTSEVRLMMLEEVQPEYRLQRLLRKGRFVEAERFANFFNLDVELIYKENVNRMLSTLQPWTKVEPSPLEDLFEVMDKIKDVHFIAKCCLNVIAPDTSTVRRLLNYGIEKIRSCENKNRDVLTIESELGDMVMRLDTYHLIHELSLTSCNTDEWLEFSTVDLFEQTHLHITKGEMKEAAIIWCRHSNWLNHLLNNIDTAMKMIEDIPNWVSASVSLIWLKEFLPSFVTIHPKALYRFVSWIYEKIKNMEVLDRKTWPDDAIRVCRDVIHITESSYKKCMFGVMSISCPSGSPIGDLNKFISVLNSLSHLKHVHGIHLSCNEFVNKDFQMVAMNLLDRVSVDRVVDLVKGFLISKAKELKLNSDGILFFYVQKLIKSLPAWCLVQEAPWEIRVSAVLNCIQNTEEFIQGVLCVIRKAAIPWSSTVKQLVDKASNLNHPLTSDIDRERSLIPQKLILKKYGCTGAITFNKHHIERLVLRIIYIDKTEALEDALQLVADSDLYDIVYSNFILKRVQERKWNLERVDRIMEGLSKELMNKIWVRVSQHLSWFLKRPDSKIEKLQLFVPFKKYIINSGFPAEKLFSACSLQEEFDVQVSVSDLCKKSSQKKLMEEIVSNSCKVPDEENNVISFVTERKVNKSSAIAKIFSKIMQIATLLGLPLQNAIFIAARQLFQDWNPKYKYLFLHHFMATEFVNSTENIKDNELFEELRQLTVQLMSELNSFNTQSSEYSLKSFALLNNLLKTFLNECTSKRTLSVGLDLSDWLHYLSGHHLEGSEQIKPLQHISIRVPEFIKSLLNDYISFANVTSNEHLSLTFKGYQLAEQEDDPQQLVITEFKSKFSNLVKYLLNSGEGPEAINFLYSVYYKLYAAFSYGQRSECSDSEVLSLWCESMGDLKFWNKIVDLCIYSTLQKIICRRRIKGPYILTLLDHFPLESIYEWLVKFSEKYCGDVGTLSYISIISMQYCEYKRKIDLWKVFSKQYTWCTWSKQLTRLNISVKDIFGDDKKLAVQHLIKHAPVEVNINLLRDFCIDVDFDFQECILMYVEHLVVSWEPEIEIKLNSNGTHVPTVKNNGEHLLKHLTCAVNVAEDVNELINHCVNTIWPKINSYYYETYLVVLDLLNYAQTRKSLSPRQENKINEEFEVNKENPHEYNVRLRSILLFLQLYKRISPPSKEELENTSSCKQLAAVSSCNNCPPIAEFRLSFTGLVEDKPIHFIKPELSLSTYELWLKVAPLIPLEKDLVCFYAIHRSFQNEFKATDSNLKTEWFIQPCNDTLLKLVEKCASHIQDMEVVSVIYYYVFKNLPPGVDRVKAAKLCYQSAENWHQITKSEESLSKLLRVKEKYFTVATWNILYKYDLAEPQYLPLALDPDELIKVLYNHPSIINRSSTLGTLNFPDINSAVEEISSVHKKDIKILKWKLIFDWLVPDNILDMDDTFLVDQLSGSQLHLNHLKKDADNFDGNVIRACYVLSTEDQETACNNLTGIAFCGDNNRWVDREPDYSARLRALQCLVRIATPEYILELTGRNETEIRELMQNLWFTSRLEQYGLLWSIESFHAYDKETLVKQLVENLSSEYIVKLTVGLCFVYNIYNPDVWNIIIRFMVDSKMEKLLKEILPELKVDWSKLDASVCVAAWNYLITSMVSQVEGACAEASFTVKECLRLILKYPRPADLNLLSFLQYCEKLNCSDLVELNILKHYLKK
ncbi:kinetochore component rough deal [Lycorma delicatula]|uniref:kinetochore component rough deal n=1 Tax=Lycorma delicatula TaxID=130591 RepID=UPI003F50E1C4